MDQKPSRKSRLSLADLERETEKFLTPATAKEKAIIDAAVALIGERGVDGATTAEIARRAGVTEKTMFRYFPSKNDLVRRVLFPIMLQRGLTRQWETREKQIKASAASLKDWFIAAASEEMAMVVKNPGIARTVTAEMIENDDIRGAMAELWQRHIGNHARKPGEPARRRQAPQRRRCRGAGPRRALHACRVFPDAVRVRPRPANGTTPAKSRRWRISWPMASSSKTGNKSGKSRKPSKSRGGG